MVKFKRVTHQQNAMAMSQSKFLLMACMFIKVYHSAIDKKNQKIIECLKLCDTSFFVVEGEGNFCPNKFSRFVKTVNCGFLKDS